MKRIILGVLVIFLALTGCDKGEDVRPAVEKERKETSRVYRLNPDISEERRLQKAVDNGGQTWRKDPVEVAHAALISQGVNVTPSDCVIVLEDEDHAIVKAKARGGNYNVHVRRLVRPGGIWTATEIEILE